MYLSTLKYVLKYVLTKLVLKYMCTNGNSKFILAMVKDVVGKFSKN